MERRGCAALATSGEVPPRQARVSPSSRWAFLRDRLATTCRRGRHVMCHATRVDDNCLSGARLGIFGGVSLSDGNPDHESREDGYMILAEVQSDHVRDRRFSLTQRHAYGVFELAPPNQDPRARDTSWRAYDECRRRTIEFIAVSVISSMAERVGLGRSRERFRKDFTDTAESGKRGLWIKRIGQTLKGQAVDSFERVAWCPRGLPNQRSREITLPCSVYRENRPCVPEMSVRRYGTFRIVIVAPASAICGSIELDDGGNQVLIVMTIMAEYTNRADIAIADAGSKKRLRLAAILSVGIDGAGRDPRLRANPPRSVPIPCPWPISGGQKQRYGPKL